MEGGVERHPYPQIVDEFGTGRGPGWQQESSLHAPKLFSQHIQEGHAHSGSPRQTANSKRTEKVSQIVRYPPMLNCKGEVKGRPAARSGCDLCLGAQNLSRALHAPRAVCSHRCTPLSETQHLLSRIRTYLPLGRHPGKFYILLGFSIFSSAPQIPKAPISTTFLILPFLR